MIEVIEKTLELEASPADVWRALTDPTEIAGWFGDSAELDLQVGGEGWFGWESHGRFAVRVEEFEPITRFAWRWARKADVPLAEVRSTLVEWTLIPKEDGGTTLLLKESGFERPEDREENVGGWKEELQDLVEHLAQ
jgi:uncharacterized protein YndB with AHSA1/START domain